MKSRNKKRLLALVLCMVVAISNSSFIFASETGQAEYPQEAEVQTQDEALPMTWTWLPTQQMKARQ